MLSTLVEDKALACFINLFLNIIIILFSWRLCSWNRDWGRDLWNKEVLKVMRADHENNWIIIIIDFIYNYKWVESLQIES